jgi:hypothetical protein
MALWQWSTTPANNASAGLIDWAEGQPPSTVNDSARQMMADVATWFQSPEWLNYGLVPTFVSATQFTTPNNQTAIYTIGRRVRAFVSSGTLYGTISASAFTSLTTVTVTWDSGALDSGVSEVDVGILNPQLPSLASLPGISITGPNGIALPNQSSPNVAPIRFGDGTGWTLRFQTTNASSTFATLTDKGDFTASGNVTSLSDERLKTDWEMPRGDFVEQLAQLLSGTFTRVDNGMRQAGIGAQSLQVLLPEAVSTNHDGMLSVAYGQAAMVACVELAKEVMRLRALLEPVK